MVREAKKPRPSLSAPVPVPSKAEPASAHSLHARMEAVGDLTEARLTTHSTPIFIFVKRPEAKFEGMPIAPLVHGAVQSCVVSRNDMRILLYLASASAAPLPRCTRASDSNRPPVVPPPA
jgi:hypothetical protein